MKKVVLGIDAAWTERNPSGLAVAVRNADGWTLSGVFGSYAAFTGQTAQAQGALLIPAAIAIAGAPPDLVAVDMPLSLQPIEGRREADNAVSRTFGGRKCGTHSPGKDRPGAIGRQLQADLAAAGYLLATDVVVPPCTIEVYPHPALLALTGARERLPYKAQKTGNYWPGASPTERRAQLMDVWSTLVLSLEERIGGVAKALPLPGPASRGAELKSFEDKLDAVVCAWVGIETLEGRTTAYGDKDAAIWIP